MSQARLHVALASVLLVACDDGVIHAFEPKLSGLGGANEPAATAGAGGLGGTTAIDSMAGAGAAAPSSPLLIDDFEDGDTRAKEPLGWWYPINDETSAQGFGVEPAGGGAASVYALRTHGSGFQEWGAAVGVDLIGTATPLNALGYEGLCFKGRVESGTSTSIQVHLLRGADHYQQQLSLSPNWTRYCLPLAEFIGPSDAALTAEDFGALQFFLPPQSRFELWLDDVELTP